MKRFLLSILLLNFICLNADEYDLNESEYAIFKQALNDLQYEDQYNNYEPNFNDLNNNSVHNDSICYQRIGRFSHEDQFDEDCVDAIIASAPKAVKQIIINLLYPPKNKAALPKRLLLVGKPGTGKTTLAKAIAYKCGYDYYIVEAPFLLNEYKNSGPQNLLREIYPLLHAGKQVVVILDELTELTDKYKKENDSDATVASALWILLDACAQFDKVFFIGTSNKEKKDLPAQLQSRFDEDIIPLYMPNDAARKKMLQHHLKDENHKIDDTFLRYLIKKTSGRSAREIEKLVYKAIQFANMRTPRRYTVTQQDFIKALKLWKPFWHPLVVYQKMEPHLQPFFKTAFPIILQTIGLVHNIYAAERGFIFQEKSFRFQKKAQEDQIALQKELHKKSMDQQKKAHKLQQYSAKLSTLSTGMQLATTGGKAVVCLVPIMIATLGGPATAAILVGGSVLAGYGWHNNVTQVKDKFNDIYSDTYTVLTE